MNDPSPDTMGPLYHINDVVTALAHEFNVAFVSEDDEDRTLDELTHMIAAAFAVGPYRVYRPLPIHAHGAYSCDDPACKEA